MDAEWVGFIGVALSAALASLGYLYQLRVERRKSIRRVLYFLLEVRYSVLAAAFDAERATDEYIEHCMTKFRAKRIPISAEDLPQKLRELIASHLQGAVAAAKTSLESPLLAQFQESLLHLASMHPVLAYRLLGREKLEKIVAMTKTYLADVLNLATVDSSANWAASFVREASLKAQRKVLQELALIFDRDVLELSRRSGVVDYLGCKRVIRKTSSQINKEFFSDLDPHIDESISALIDVARQGSGTVSAQ